MWPKKAGVAKKAKVANEVRIPKRAGVAKESWDDQRKLDWVGQKSWDDQRKIGWPRKAVMIKKW